MFSSKTSDKNKDYDSINTLEVKIYDRNNFRQDFDMGKVRYDSILLISRGSASP